MPFHVADGDIIGPKLMQSLLAEEKEEGDLILVLCGEMELPREVMRHLVGIESVSQERRVAAD